MDDRITSYRARLAEIDARIKFLADEAGKRELTSEEVDEIASLEVEQTGLIDQIQSHEKLAKMSMPKAEAAATEATSTRRTTPSQVRIEALPNLALQRRAGFDNFGQFAHAVYVAQTRGRMDDRLARMAPSTWSNEGAGADGGFSVPPEFRQQIASLIDGESQVFSRTDRVTTSSNNYTVVTDEDSPWSTSGVRVYWTGEGDAITQSKPVLKQQTLVLHKLAGLCPVTDELLSDSPGFGQFLQRKMAEKLAFELDRVVIAGLGAGQPLGILAAACTVSVAKESSQVAATLIANNVIKMWSRIYGQSASRAVWLVNQDIYPQLLKLSMAGTDNDGNAVTGWGFGVYQPANGLSVTPYGTLFGRPIVVTQACSTLGTAGDIILADLSQYLTVTKTSGPQVDVDMSLFFDYVMSAWRIVFRVAGQPWWSTTVSAKNGSATYSPFVTLAVRS